MDYRDIFKEDNESAQERYELVTERIRDIVTEKVLPDTLQKYFKTVSEFIIFVADLFEDIKKIHKDYLDYYHPNHLNFAYFLEFHYLFLKYSD